MARTQEMAASDLCGLPADRRLLWLPIALAVIVYLPTLGHGFAYDDPGLVASLEGGPPRIHRILLWISAWVDHAFWGDRPLGYHITNVALHGIVTLLVTLVARRLVASSAAIVAGVLFAVHPVHADVVTTIVHRKEMLAMGFGLGAVLAWRTSGRITRQTTIFGTVAVVLYVLALLSKEVSIAALPMILVLSHRMQIWRDGSTPPRWPVLAMLGVGIAGAIASLASTGIGHFSPEHIARIHGGQITSYPEVLTNVLAGAGRAAGYWTGAIALVAEPPLVRGSIGVWPWLGPLLVLGALPLITAWVGASRRLTWFAIAWVIVMLFPATNVIPLSHFYLPPRYLYVSSFGVVLVAGALLVASYDTLRRRTSRPRPVRVVSVSVVSALVVMLAWKAVDRSRDWRSDDVIWQQAAEAGAVSLRAHQGLARAAVAASDYRAAVTHLEAAAALIPLTSDRIAFGYDGDVHRDLAWAYSLAGRVDAAGALGTRIVDVLPDDVSGHLLAARGALAASDDRAAYRHFRRLDELRPGEARTAMSLALILATTDDAELRDAEEAVRLAKRAVAVSPSPEHLRVLAVAHGATGVYEAAILTASRARQLALSEGATSLVEQLDADLARYRAELSANR